MISEPQQEQATLYALGLLDADEAAAVERAVAGSTELGALVRDLRESASSLALLAAGADVKPPLRLRDRVLQSAAADRLPPSAAEWRAAAGNVRRTETVVVRTHFSALAWALAAAFMACSAWLFMQLGEARSERGKLAGTVLLLQRAKPIETLPPPDPLTQVAFCELEPTPALANQPRAAVLWDAVHRKGVLRVFKLPRPPAGKDYELWTVQEGHKDPLPAGLVRVDVAGGANLPFQPTEADGQVAAVAISLEKEGGSPTAQGPILLLGKF